MCVTICGKFRSDEGAVAGYGNRIRVKSPAKWGVQIAGIIFQTRSSQYGSYLIFDVLERVWKIIPAICTPHFAGDFTRIQLP